MTIPTNNFKIRRLRDRLNTAKELREASEAQLEQYSQYFESRIELWCALRKNDKYRKWANRVVYELEETFDLMGL